MTQNIGDIKNKVPNNNDVMYIANIMLNELNNSNNAMRIANKVQLTTMGAQQLSVEAI